MVAPELPEAVSRRYPYGYAVVDVETSGLSAQHHRVLQIAITQIGSDGTMAREWSTLLDPGCDPGPVHVHGLTRERLAGSPVFTDVAHKIFELLDGRVLVAHNARFDWQFLAIEAQRSNLALPVRHRLCTIALSRRLDLPLAGMSLDVVAQYWGVDRVRAHDAVDDTRVLVEVLRHSLVVADRLQASLPLATCDLDQLRRGVPPNAPRTNCVWKYPGHWRVGSPLVQGMKVVFTGDTTRPRDVLIREATAAGLDVMNNVSSRTSLLVRNPGSDETGKSKAARLHQTMAVEEAVWTQMLTAVAPGTAKSAGSEPRRASSAIRPTAAQTGPLTKRRVLVLGGPHSAAALVRERIAVLGGQAAANLTATVTHAVLLDDADLDPRYGKVRAAGLPLLDPSTLEPSVDLTHVERATSAPLADVPDPVVLGHGVVTDLPGEIDGWSLSVAWQDALTDPITVDVIAMVVDPDEQVRADADFCFFNQPGHPTGAVDLDLDTTNEALAVIRPSHLPDEQRRILFAAAIEGDRTFGDLGPIEVTMRTPDGVVAVRSTLDAGTTERSMLLATVYERGSMWRVRAIGQGYEFGLAHLAVLHGVDIED